MQKIWGAQAMVPGNIIVRQRQNWKPGDPVVIEGMVNQPILKSIPDTQEDKDSQTD